MQIVPNIIRRGDHGPSCAAVERAIKLAAHNDTVIRGMDRDNLSICAVAAKKVTTKGYLKLFPILATVHGLEHTSEAGGGGSYEGIKNGRLGGRYGDGYTAGAARTEDQR